MKFYTVPCWVKDDPLLFDYNVEERVNDFVAAAISQVYRLFLYSFAHET